MPSTAPANPSATQTPALFWVLLGAFIALALVPTLWTSLDLASAALFHGNPAAIHAEKWWWVQLINFYTPAVFRTIVLIALAAWLWATLRPAFQQWRLPLAFVVLAGALGPGLVVNNGFKENWQRARPYQVQEFGGPQQFTRAAVMTDQCNNNCSFVSGHVACGFFAVSMMLVLRRRKVAWAVGGVAAGWVIGFARMSDHAHWLSDVLWAGPITLMSSWLVWKGLVWAYRVK